MRAAVVRNSTEDLSIETDQDSNCPDNGVVLRVTTCGVCAPIFTDGLVGTRR
jgi:D-arabinose 1-dehydrogenase-like Zn-dependent alcohol dehydrogenase